jgi:hypothetical protein
LIINKNNRLMVLRIPLNIHPRRLGYLHF